MIKQLSLFSAAILALYITQYQYRLQQENQPFLQDANTSPIIGIFTQSNVHTECSTGKCSFIAASYVKFIEESGARVVPIPYDADEITLANLFKNINGILVPGGATTLEGPSKFTLSIAFMMNLAMKANDNGDFFPIMGVCLGHEAIHYVLSDFDKNYKIKVSSEDQVIHALQKANRDAYFYRDMDDQLFDILTTQNISYYHHTYAISPKLYTKNSKVDSIMQITAVNSDVNGLEFIASAQGKKYPIITTQYHTEKNPFEWEIVANHTNNAIKVTQAHSNAFVELSRQNNHRFEDTKLLNSSLIYNYPQYHYSDSVYTTVYLMDKVNPNY